MKEEDEKEVLFWSKLLYPVIFSELKRGEIRRYLEKVSQEEVVFPDGTKKKPGLSTLWKKLRLYKEGGVDAFLRKPRSDRGKVRSVDEEIIAKAVELKRDQPLRSHKVINEFLDYYYGVTIPKSTLYRHLRKRGATKVKLGVSKTPVRCRWTRDHSNSLWMGDFEFGPFVFSNGKSSRTYLSAFIDAHSRFIVSGRYYLQSNLDVLEDSLTRAWELYGAPREIYLDNAKVYYANALKLSCLALNIKLLHRPPRDPAPGGLIEKFFQTVQSQFESEIKAGELLTLDQLNENFSAWLNSFYQKSINSQTNETPTKRYQAGLQFIRHVDIKSIARYFHKQQIRTVHRDFSDISLFGKLYQVDSSLKGDKVTVYYDPRSDNDNVLIHSLDDQFLCQGKLYQREKSEQPSLPAISTPPKHDFLALLCEKQQQLLQKQIEGVDYSQISSHRWPFISFVQLFAKLLGRQGGASAFDSNEYQALKDVYQLHPNLSQNILREAFEMATHQNIVQITFQIQNLLSQE